MSDKKLTRSLLLITAAVLITCSLSVATGAALRYSDGTITIDLKQARLGEVIDRLRQQSGAEIVVWQRKQLDKLVDVDLTNVTIEQALERIATDAGLYWRKSGGAYYISPVPMDDGGIPVKEYLPASLGGGGGIGDLRSLGFSGGETALSPPGSIPPPTARLRDEGRLAREFIHIRHEKCFNVARFFGWKGAIPGEKPPQPRTYEPVPVYQEPGRSDLRFFEQLITQPD